MKVFVTVGSMLPFDRLVAAMDDWAAAHPNVQCFAQIGAGGTPPRHMPFSEMLAPAEFRRHCLECDVIVSHLGMGTVLSAAELQRPLVALIRQQTLREANSEHQTATAAWLKSRPGIVIAENASALAAAVEATAGRAGPKDFETADRSALTAAVADFLHDAVHRTGER